MRIIKPEQYNKKHSEVKKKDKIMEQSPLAKRHLQLIIKIGSQYETLKQQKSEPCV